MGLPCFTLQIRLTLGIVFTADVGSVLACWRHFHFLISARTLRGVADFEVQVCDTKYLLAELLGAVGVQSVMADNRRWTKSTATQNCASKQKETSNQKYAPIYDNNEAD